MSAEADRVEVTVNGKPRAVPIATSLADIVLELSPTGSGCAIAVNGEVAPRAGWRDRRVQAGDRIDVLTAVQGG